MQTIDFNCDLGESFGPYRIGCDADVLPLISSANVACGFHAGDSTEMRRTVQLANAHGVAIGAHPGLADIRGFGRCDMAVPAQRVYDDVVYQIGALQAVAVSQSTRVRHVKPHGALYHMGSDRREYAEAIVQAIAAVDRRLLLFAMAGTELAAAGERAGLRVVYEAFADRTYQPDGSLTPRSAGNALIEDADEALSQVLQMLRQGSVRATDGSVLPVKAETICIHGDGVRALAFAAKIRSGLRQQGIDIQAWPLENEQCRDGGQSC
ncbi:MAG: 5-oxoprolinase subunit PxpA [Sporolactobacillus sp.]